MSEENLDLGNITIQLTKLLNSFKTILKDKMVLLLNYLVIHVQ